jgi:hypothetical protein
MLQFCWKLAAKWRVEAQLTTGTGNNAKVQTMSTLEDLRVQGNDLRAQCEKLLRLRAKLVDWKPFETVTTGSTI